tara:strand:- start:633 stop:875 length:243 start_codon:yes stop_codon:yes gene_type:complete
MTSKFTVKAGATEDEIWNKILETLTPEERAEAVRSFSEVNEPYEGGKEITIKTNDKSNIAFASISEIRKLETDWSVYKEV